MSKRRDDLIMISDSDLAVYRTANGTKFSIIRSGGRITIEYENADCLRTRAHFEESTCERLIVDLLRIYLLGCQDDPAAFDKAATIVERAGRA